MSRSKKHVHKYHLVNLAATPVWACALPDCTHYMPHHMSKMVPGKMSVCWGCGEDFVLDYTAMQNNHPRCVECRGELISEDVPMSDAMKSYIESKLG
jgi:hypothetical protein